MVDECLQCGKEYKLIAKHWSQSTSCDYPDITDTQEELVIGLLMGDGCLNIQNHCYPRLQVCMTSPNYLKYIDKEFGMFGNGVNLKQTGKQKAEEARKYGFNENAKEENYKDYYRWQSVTHPQLQKFESWYSSGEKVWPKGIELTPTILKHWYCGDGTWSNKGGNNHIAIGISNESKNTKKVSKIFQRSGLPEPNYNFWDNDCSLSFTVEQSKKMWEYMGKPLPDFEYKWPDRYC